MFQAFVLIFSLLWIGLCFCSLPYAIRFLKTNAQEKKWAEFSLGLLVLVFLWLGALFVFFFFVWPVIHFFITLGNE